MNVVQNNNNYNCIVFFLPFLTLFWIDSIAFFFVLSCGGLTACLPACTPVLVLYTGLRLQTVRLYIIGQLRWKLIASGQ